MEAWFSPQELEGTLVRAHATPTRVLHGTRAQARERSGRF